MVAEDPYFFSVSLSERSESIRSAWGNEKVLQVH